MIDSAIETELSNCLEQLSVEKQMQVLAFARALRQPIDLGVKGTSLLQFAGGIEEADLDRMSQAIENGCERIDVNEW